MTGFAISATTATSPEDLDATGAIVKRATYAALSMAAIRASKPRILRITLTTAA